MVKKKAGSNRPVSTQSVASKSPISTKSDASAGNKPPPPQSGKNATTHAKKTNTLVNAKTVQLVQDMTEASTHDRVAFLKVEADMKKEESRKDAYSADMTIPSFKISDEMEFEMIECLRKSYQKDQWKGVLQQSEYDDIQEQTASLSVHQQSSLVFQKHNIIYYTLEKMGFPRHLIQTILWETQGHSLQMCLDWALMWIDPEQLPTGLTDKHLHATSNTSFTLVSKIPSDAPSLARDVPVRPVVQEATTKASAPKKQGIDSSLKAWILNQAMQSDEEEEEEKEPEITIPTNIHYAQLKLQQEQVKEALKMAKEQNQEDQVKDLQTKQRELKSKMDQVSKNKDYNPKTANIEFKRLMEEKNESSGKSKKKKTETVQEGSGDLFGDMFSESNAAHSTPSRNNSISNIRDMCYSGWTGKSPKQYFNDYLSKNAKGTKLTFQPVHDKGAGFRLKAILKGGPKAFDGQEAEMNQDERVGNIREAEHFAATKLMYKMISDRPIHTLLPPPYRELWLEMKTTEKMVDKIQVANENEERIQFLVKLKESVQSNGSLNTPSSSANVLPTPDMSSRKSHFVLKPNPSVSASLLQELNHRKQTEAYIKLMNQRSQLPVFQHRKEILDTVQNHRMIIISGDTGSGKSTQIPQFILEHALEQQASAECQIVCTQPRRISAVSIAQRVSEELGDAGVGDPGSWVGYQIRLESKVSKTTKLVFATTGVLLRRLESDPDLKGISHIVVDEVHERSLDSDFLLLLLRRLLARRSDFRVILMSATAEAEKFAHYFASYIAPDAPALVVCPWISVPGRTFPVNTFYLEDAVESSGYILEQDSEFSKKRTVRRSAGSVNVTGKGGNTFKMKLEWDESDDSSADELDAGTEVNMDSVEPSYSATTRKALKWMDPNKLNTDLIYQLVRFIHEHGPADSKDEKGSILIFLPGLAEIKRVHDILSSNSRNALDGLLVLPLHSVLGSKEQGKVFLPAPATMRKVVLATNIAETGITIPDIVYVIDTCRAREIGQVDKKGRLMQSYDNRRHITRLTEVFVSKANCTQRRGRAGRVKEGICYHLIPKKAFDVDHRPPEIVRLPLEELCLRIRASGFKEPVAEFLSDCIDAPPEKNISRSVEELVKIQAFDAFEKLTPLGYKLADIPVDVRLGKMLLYGVAMSCLDPILTAAAALSLGRSPFSRPFGKETEAAQAHQHFKTAFEQWRAKIAPTGSLEAARNFCYKHYLSFQNMTLIEEARGQLLNLLMGVDAAGRDALDKEKNKSYIQTMLKLKYNRHGKSLPVVSTAICAGLYPNVLLTRIDPLPEGLTPKQPLFQLYSPGSSEVIRPHSAKSMYSSGPDMKKPVWFAYHAMTRMAGGSGSAQLKVWDITKVGCLPIITFAGSTGQVEHRQRILNLNDTIKIKCPPRSAVALSLFTRHVSTLLDARIMNPNSVTDESDTLLQLYFKLLEQEWKSWE